MKIALAPALVSLAIALDCGAPAAIAQTDARVNPLRLEELHRAAIQSDPRFRELQLQAAQTDLRLGRIGAERLPSVTAESQAQYQSDVPTPPSFVPGGRPLFAPPKQTYDTYLRMEQRIVDPSLGPRQAVERAQLAEGQARVRTSLYALRADVNDAFFGAAMLQARGATLAASIASLEARLRETRARVREGAALGADAAAVEATLLQRRQEEDDVRARRVTALSVLSSLTGRTISENDALDLPDVQVTVAEARRAWSGTRARPEYERFARARDVLARQQDAIAASELPRLGAFARAGYGRPGLNFISDQFEAYGFVGLRVQWNALTWGTARRDREALAIQQQIVAADEAAFTSALGRSIDADLATIDRLERTLGLDDRIVVLREEIARTAEIRFGESVITASEYLDRNTELLEARLARAAHGVELSQARARFLTSLGLEVR